METFIPSTQRMGLLGFASCLQSRLQKGLRDSNNLKTRHLYSLSCRINRSLLHIVPRVIFRFSNIFIYYTSFFSLSSAFFFLHRMEWLKRIWTGHLVQPVGSVSTSQPLWVSFSPFNSFCWKLLLPSLDWLGNFTAFQNIIKLFNHLSAYYEKKPLKP